MNYRSDIDGLRAIAIIPVILFHLGFNVFSGGFVGVDVFFVISGYLITSVILKDIEKKTFSFVTFYEHRIRRIFPALFVVVIVVSILSYYLLLPSDFRSFSQSIVASITFCSNILFWNTSGYFDAPAEFKPLLHTWSLSVEEQFYIAFPFLLIWMMRLFQKKILMYIFVFMMISFIASVLVVQTHASSAFYLPQFRAWELLLGATLAFRLIPPLSTSYSRHILSMIGLVLIAYSVFSLSSGSLFPGANALYPCVGAALIIYSGSGGHSSIIGKMLSWRPLVLTGLISYSLYLWHWPIIVLTKYYLIRHLDFVDKIFILFFVVMAGMLSWRFIERPFRSKSGLLSRGSVFKISIVFMILLISIGLSGYLFNGFSDRLSQRTLSIADAKSEKYSFEMFVEESIEKTIPLVDLHILGNVSVSKPSFLVWGDSHALALAPAFDQLANQNKISGLLFSANGAPPLLGVHRYDNVIYDFKGFNDAVATYIEDHKELKTVFLVARWSLYANGSRYGNESDKAIVISPVNISENYINFQSGLENSIRFLNKKNIRVIFIEDVPEVGWNVPSTLAREKWLGRPSVLHAPTVFEYNDRQQKVRESYGYLRHSYSFEVINMSSLFCPNGQCLVVKDGSPLYRDDDHLSVKGALLTIPLLKGFF